jgi:hypothetical protein
MKKIILALIAISTISITQGSAQGKQKAKPAQTKSRDEDGIDGRMKGPNGEVVYIGDKGGRYYMSAAGNKVYVPLAGKGLKSKTAKTVKKIEVK